MSRPSRFVRFAVCAALSVVSVVALAPAAQAGTITVSTTFDESAANSACSLREAVETANDDADSGGCTDANAALADTIVLGGGDYNLSRAGVLDDANVNGDLDITEDLTIKGIGAEATGIDGNGGTTSDRVLDVVIPGGQTVVDLSGLTVHDGSSAADGGGIDADNGVILNLTNTNVSGNEAVSDGGGVAGTINNNDVNLTNSTVSGNVAGASGGGIDIAIADLNNSAVTGNDAGAGGGGIRAVTARLTNSAVSGNDAATSGGGIETRDFTVNGNATLVGSKVSNNRAAGTGGGIKTTDATLTDSTVSGNDAVSHGGGIFTDAGSVTVTRSTINGNDAGGNGGGILFSPPAGQTLNVTNSTLSGNQAKVHGGGISADADTILSNTTVTDNTADSDNVVSAGNGGGIARFAPGIVSLRNTILAGNRDLSGGGQDCFGALNSEGYNFFGETSGCTITGVTTGNTGGPSPLLEPLGANGGPTLTHALLPISHEIDTGYPGSGPGMPCEATDQRGLPRGGGAGLCDIGAFEVQPPPVPPAAAAVVVAAAPLSPPVAVKKKCKKGRKLRKGKCVKKKK